MKNPVICPIAADFFIYSPEQRHNAVLFRDRVYVAAPRHLDAITLAFKDMTEKQRHRVSNRIADGKEEMLFGTALGDGSDWEWNEEFQRARMTMYGFD
jgi:hypothetical protein